LQLQPTAGGPVWLSQHERYIEPFGQQPLQRDLREFRRAGMFIGVFIPVLVLLH
jgi:hypothetical protein